MHEDPVLWAETDLVMQRLRDLIIQRTKQGADLMLVSCCLIATGADLIGRIAPDEAELANMLDSAMAEAMQIAKQVFNRCMEEESKLPN